MNPRACEVVLQPVGKRIAVPAGTTLLEAARLAGVELAAVCGGEGTCGTCRVRPLSASVSSLSDLERAEISPADQAAGIRLACQAKVLADLRVDIPAESLTAAQRLQVEGQETAIQPDPVVVPFELHLPTPQPGDPHPSLPLSDARMHPSVTEAMPGLLRASDGHARLALRGADAVAVLPAGSALFGLAVDVGTTKLAAYLMNLETGALAAQAGAMNPQIAYGEDVISRIHYANQNADGGARLQSRLIETLNQLIETLCAQAGSLPAQVVEAVLVGNTAMHHLLAGLPVRQLGEAPYAPAVRDALELNAAELGLHISPGARAYLPPVVAGFVGADHIAMLLATGAGGSARTTIALDIGTNTEISLFAGGKITCCSCASGPAFEGAHIREGMRAAPGAIERARWLDGRVHWQTIDGLPPVGICGSGILDIVAALLDGGQIRATGQLLPGAEIVLARASQTGGGRDLLVTRKDVNEIQLAKAAIRTGVESLLKQAGLTYEAIDQFIVAGAFGTYLDLRSAVRVGMFPPLPLERFRQVGNAAGVGARQMLVSAKKRREAELLAGALSYIELASDPGFTGLFMKFLSFDVNARSAG